MCKRHYKHLSETGRVLTYREADASRVNMHEATGGACMRELSPCGETRCRYHLAEEKEDLRARQDLIEPCALKVANDGAMSLDAVGYAMGITHERARQIEVKALRRLRDGLAQRGFTAADIHEVIALKVSG